MLEHSVGAAAAAGEPTFEPIRRRRGRAEKRPPGAKRRRRMQRAARAAQRDELARLAADGFAMEAGS